MTTLRIYSLKNLQAFLRAVLTIFIMLDVTSQDLIISKPEVCAFDHFHPITPPHIFSFFFFFSSTIESFKQDKVTMILPG